MKKLLWSIVGVCGLGMCAWAAEPPAANVPTAPAPTPAATAPAAPTTPTVVTSTTPARRMGLLSRLRARRAARIVYMAPVTASPATTYQPTTPVPMPMPKPNETSSTAGSSNVVPASGTGTSSSAVNQGTTTVVTERVMPVRRMGLLQRLRLRR
ncbi:MAG: hypothetical protein NZU63_13715 [Gemmataceae bacterium]|nr:hypothetical protein [Gemmataceae bacterium]MDW8243803.1 hypothetical protein [Thermogemmata sp.]